MYHTHRWVGSNCHQINHFKTEAAINYKRPQWITKNSFTFYLFIFVLIDRKNNCMKPKTSRYCLSQLFVCVACFEFIYDMEFAIMKKIMSKIFTLGSLWPYPFMNGFYIISNVLISSQHSLRFTTYVFP